MTLHIDHLPHSGAPVLVLVHGWAMHGGIFDTWSRSLSTHFELFRLDLPGHGHSRLQQLELADALAYCARALPVAHWCGWSLGGAFAMQMANHYPERVQSLICVASSPCFVARHDWADAMEPTQFQRFADELRIDWRAVVQRFLALEALGSTCVQAELHTLQQLVFARGEPSFGGLQQGLRWLADWDLRPALRQLTLPSLWLAGARDRLVRPQAMAHAAELARGQYCRLEGAGHAPFLHFGETLSDQLVAFHDQLAS